MKTPLGFWFLTASQPIAQKSLMAMNGVGLRAGEVHALWALFSTRFTSPKTQAIVGNPSARWPGGDAELSALEMGRTVGISTSSFFSILRRRRCFAARMTDAGGDGCRRVDRWGTLWPPNVFYRPAARCLVVGL